MPSIVRRTTKFTPAAFVFGCLLLPALAMLSLLATSTGGGPAAEAHASIAFPSQEEKPTPTIWRPCPINDRAGAEHDLVRRFARAPGVTPGGPVMPGGASDLLCGTERYGYYHIVARHHGDWTQMGAKSSENWRDVADYSIAEALKSPMAVAFRASTNTFCYSREVSLVNKVRGIVVEVMHPNVVVRAGDGAIITAFPSGRPCGS